MNDFDADIARQRLAERRIASALRALGYDPPVSGETKLVDAMETIAKALEDLAEERARLGTRVRWG